MSVSFINDDRRVTLQNNFFTADEIKLLFRHQEEKNKTVISVAVRFIFIHQTQDDVSINITLIYIMYLGQRL